MALRIGFKPHTRCAITFNDLGIRGYDENFCGETQGKHSL